METLPSLHSMRQNKASTERIMLRWLQIKEFQRSEEAFLQYHHVMTLTQDLIHDRDEVLNITFYPDSFDGRWYVNEILREFKDDFPELNGSIRPYPIECYIEYGSKWGLANAFFCTYFSLVQAADQYIQNNIVRLRKELVQGRQCSLFD